MHKAKLIAKKLSLRGRMVGICSAYRLVNSLGKYAEKNRRMGTQANCAGFHDAELIFCPAAGKEKGDKIVSTDNFASD
jgi:hypothetical protein